MAEIKRKLKKSKLTTRVTSAVLAIAVLVSAIVWYNNDNAKAADSRKDYFSHIIKRLQAGLQDEINILEIVPYDGQGEFRYFVGEQEVINGLNSNQAALYPVYEGIKGVYGNVADDVWYDVPEDYTPYGFQIMKSSANGEYRVKSTHPLASKIAPNYADILADAYNVYTVEANDLQVTDKNDADYADKIANGYIDLDTIDIVVISSGNHSNVTTEIYEAYTNNAIDAFYDNAGNVLNDNTSYDTFEKYDDGAGNVTYQSRDAYWGMCEKLLDFMINGKQVQLTDETTQTLKVPVIMDDKITDELEPTGNMYKLSLIYRMCDEAAWNLFKTRIATIDSAGNTMYATSGVVTISLDSDGDGNRDDKGKTFLLNDMTKFGTTSGSTLYDNDPFAHDTYLTDNYWVFSGDTLPLPEDVTTLVQMGDGLGFDDRTDKQTSIKEIYEYLLGARDGQINANYDLGGGTLRILEVEPCNSFDYDEAAEVDALKAALRIENGNIEVDCVSTNALNGMVDDLIATYDIIIIGENYQLLTKDDATGKTIYNDRNLNGYIYLAYGDLLKMTTAYLGLLPEDYIQVPNNTKVGIDDGNITYDADEENRIRNNEIRDHHRDVRLSLDYRPYWTDYVYESLHNAGTDGKTFAVVSMYEYYKVGGTALGGNASYDNDGSLYLDYYMGNSRYPENDITSLTKEKLLRYAEAGKALVFADCLYDVDKTMVYPTSDMCAFAEEMATTDAYGDRIYDVVRQSEIGAVMNKLSSHVPEITITQKPVEPTYTADGLINSFAERQLNYTIHIKGQAGTNYKVKLFIDRNNDGIYKDVDSGITDDTNELYVTEWITLTSNEMDYTIKSEVSDNFVGMLSWMIEVVEIDAAGNETNYSATEKGYAAIKNDTPQVVNVLEIVVSNPAQITGRLDEGEFKQLLDDIADPVGYITNVEVVDVEEYLSWFEDNAGVENNYIKGSADKGYGSDRDKLKNYDMLVLGYADGFNEEDIINVNGALDNIIDYMNSGKSVLFTHDSLSYRSNPTFTNTNATGTQVYSQGNGGWEITGAGAQENDASWRNNYSSWGSFAFFNTITMRDIVGMDKYGVTLSETDRNSDDKYNIPQYASTVGKPTYETDDKINEIQGLSASMLIRGNFIRNFATEYQNDGIGLYTISPYEGVAMATDYEMAMSTNVEQTNEGSITMYPFKIDENIAVAQTHAQYYELNMEDEDIVVWYTLAGDINGNGRDNFFGVTSKDAGNNYYIYSKNNITYSGAGHSKLDDNNTKTPPTAEMKLFVNTIIRAISGGNVAPVLVNTNGALTGDKTYTVYANSADTAANYQIDFMATDTDMLTLEAANNNIYNVGRFKVAEMYWIMPDGTEKLIESFNPNDADDCLRNGVQKQIKLGTTDLASMTVTVKDAAGNDTTMGALAYIEELIESGEGDPAQTVKFRIDVADWYDEKVSININMVERNLFNLN